MLMDAYKNKGVDWGSLLEAQIRIELNTRNTVSVGGRQHGEEQGSEFQAVLLSSNPPPKGFHQERSPFDPY